MFYPDPQTKFKRKYAPRFNRKHSLSKIDDLKKDIHDYTIKIANHPSPNDIGGSATCPNDKFKKLTFNTGWSILYEVRGDLIEFIAYYLENPWPRVNTI